MRLAVVVLVGMLGCSTTMQSPRAMTSPRTRAPPCGLESPSLAVQLATGIIASALVGGVVALGYTAIGGESP